MGGAITPVKDYCDIRLSLWFGEQVEVGSSYLFVRDKDLTPPMLSKFLKCFVISLFNFRIAIFPRLSVITFDTTISLSNIFLKN